MMANKLAQAQISGVNTAGLSLGGIAKGVLNFGKNLIPGGIDDAIINTLVNRGGRSDCPTGFVFRNGRCEQTGLGGVIARGIPGGNTGFLPAPVTQATAVAGMTIACPQGYRPNKSSYYTKQGFVQKGTKCVRARRRNTMNERALRRALSRVEGFGRLEKRVDKAARKALRDFK